jgi:hypothetical protein
MTSASPRLTGIRASERVTGDTTYGSMRGRWKRSHGSPYTGTKGETPDTDKGSACRATAPVTYSTRERGTVLG